MKHLIVLFTLCTMLACCAHRQPALNQPPAQAATSTAAQSEEIAPLVVTATGAGIVAAGAGVYLKSGPLVASGATVAVSALTLQRFLPYIPWVIVAGLVGLASWAVWSRTGMKKMVVAHEDQLHAVAATLEGGFANARTVAANIRTHLHDTRNNKIPVVPVAAPPAVPTTLGAGATPP